MLELEELAAKKDLQAVIMFLLMYRITQNMYLTRDKPKVCILDEAWALLGGGGSGDFIETGYRRARKYNGSFCAATQSIGDFSLSRAAEGQMGHGIGRVLFDPFSLLLVSSKAEDFEAVRYYRERGYSIVDSLEAVLADRGVPGYANKQNRKAA